MNARLVYLIAVVTAALATLFLAGETDTIKEDFGARLPGMIQTVW
ncbi:hypothetical protein [Cupriavidus pinatubonensis]|uniref:Transmembrane protein n=1 Tax=Cupriavidus pinatubonensis TaxID=248026 RepID=A0ABN7ZP05_9BURK|nr:hypothetical protein [Cupriavidus pinatubonensis]CAG9187682.1 hypothetical protein LMG23994_07127 [Cupriavidus pinatubonensis]